jgi:hypothetical protein
VLHLDTEDPGGVIEAVKGLGFSVEERAR